MKKYDYDLIVIGGGAAGFVASKLAQGLGKKVAMVEKRKLGGECTNYGCVPSKALIRVARVAHELKRARDFGLEFDGASSLRTGKVMAHVRSVVDKIYRGHPPEKFEALGINVIFGSPRFLDKHRVMLGDRTLSARRFIIATGSRAFVPPIEGVNTVPYLTNESFFRLDELPASMIILGGGPIGMEFASALNRLGVEITVVELLDRILFREDREPVEMLTSRLKAEGVALLTSTRAVKFSQGNGKVSLTVEREGKTSVIRAESVLIAIGRQPNIEGLDLERAGVKFTNKGVVADKTLRTTAPSIYACGDVVGPYQFSHMAEYQAVIACLNAFFPYKRKADYANVIWTTFTDPELARAGLTEEEARQRYGDRVKVYRYDYRVMDRAVTDREDFGMSKYICDRKGRLIGVHVLGSHATEVLHEAQLAKSFGIPFAKIQKVIHSYPSYSDAVRQPAKARYVDEVRSNFFVRLVQKLVRKK